MSTEASHQVSRIQHRASRIKHPASSIVNPASRYESFLQNKPNLPDNQMNITAFIVKNYEEIRPSTPRKNKPNTNPNKPNYSEIVSPLRVLSPKYASFLPKGKSYVPKGT